MENEGYNIETVCKAGSCGYQAKGRRLDCIDGRGTCMAVSLLEAEESAFHDRALIGATQSIMAILADIPADPDGRTLSFIHTNMGTLLAWVNHNAEVADDAVTEDDDDATIAAALKLKNVTFADAAAN